MHLRVIDYVFWFSASAIQLGVLVVMFRRGLHREYPYFFNYTILRVLSDLILFIVHKQSYTLYYFSYWLSAALSALLAFAVLYEIFQQAFRPYEALRDLGVILFRWSALVILLVAGMWAATSGHPAQERTITDAILLAERSVRLMQCGLVFFLLLFSEYLGISRRNLLFGIALGFGLFASVNMLRGLGLVARWSGTCLSFALDQQRCLQPLGTDLAVLHSDGSVAKCDYHRHSLSRVEFCLGRHPWSRHGR